MLDFLNQNYIYFFILPLVAFLAGFIDSIVGGGGLVQVPSLFILFPTFPVPMVIGSNRFASFMGTSVAAYQYAKKVSIPWKTVLCAGIGTAIFAYLGAELSSFVSAKILKPIVLILMSVIAIYTFIKKDLGGQEKFKVANILAWSFLIGMMMGFYNGFVGPGTGSLLVFGFVSIIGYNFLTGSAISKFVNVIADVSSLFFFVLNDFVNYKVALPMMIFNMLGSYIGSRLAILKGNEFVRILFLVVVGALILRFAYDIWRTL
ncbi:MAG: sulfite exporter TauE/SafE family protein [Cytophagales bacterium]|nr:MAG: sulfite exporter TauE/SafE family protein [Cytophagales bacterium]